MAVHTAPVDPYTMVARAARTHWRAAAWLLERTDPDRFAKRPPNSCRPETLLDVSAWLIETALEATAPEQRETVYRRMQAVADKAFDVLMPDQHDARRALVGALPERPMPLSEHEIAKTLRVVHDRPDLDAPSAPAGGLFSAQASSPGSPNLGGAAAGGAPPTGRPLPPAAAQLQEAGRPARLNGTATDATAIADPVAFYRAQPPRKSPACRPRTHIEGFRLLDSDRMDADWRYALEDEDEADDGSLAPTGGGVSDADAARPLPPDAGRPSSHPPNEGIMSPKMSPATKVVATECDTAGVPPTLGSHKAGDGIAGRMSA